MNRQMTENALGPQDPARQLEQELQKHAQHVQEIFEHPDQYRMGQLMRESQRHFVSTLGLLFNQVRGSAAPEPQAASPVSDCSTSAKQAAA